LGAGRKSCVGWGSRQAGGARAWPAVSWRRSFAPPPHPSFPAGLLRPRCAGQRAPGAAPELAPAACSGGAGGAGPACSRGAGEALLHTLTPTTGGRPLRRRHAHCRAKLGQPGGGQASRCRRSPSPPRPGQRPCRAACCLAAASARPPVPAALPLTLLLPLFRPPPFFCPTPAPETGPRGHMGAQLRRVGGVAVRNRQGGGHPGEAAPQRRPSARSATRSAAPRQGLPCGRGLRSAATPGRGDAACCSLPLLAPCRS
jgi:hypothetical protein